MATSPSGFQHKMCVHLFPSMRSTCPAHFIPRYFMLMYQNEVSSSKDEDGSIGNASDMYSGGTGFKSLHKHVILT